MLLQPTILHLIGSPGAGKYTIAREISALTGARLVDNHAIANVIFNLLDQDGVKPLPPGVFERVRAVHRAVLDTMMHVSPKDLSFVFTNFFYGGEPEGTAMFEELAAVAEIRGSRFVPVLVSCETPEIVRRIVAPSRKERMKLIDPAQGARINDDLPPFTTDRPNTMRIDVTSLAPALAAQAIVDWANACPIG